MMGWKSLPKDPEMIQYTAQNPDGKWGMIPDYPNDLNAMHEAESLLGDGYKRVQYLDRLCWICRRDGMDVPWIEAPFANAAQKAEALLSIFERWQETPASLDSENAKGI